MVTRFKFVERCGHFFSKWGINTPASAFKGCTWLSLLDYSQKALQEEYNDHTETTNLAMVR
jgi:hypothetical protein